MRVRDVMTQDVATVAPDTDLRDLAALLVEKRISGVPVVEGGRVVGVVSERDILFKERPSEGLSRGVLALAHGRGRSHTQDRRQNRPRGDDLAAAHHRDPRAASRMQRRPCWTRTFHACRLSITDGSSGSSRSTTWSGRLHAPTSEIRREIDTDPLVRSCWQRPSDYHVAVEKGAVTLSGKVGNKEQARLIEAFVDRVPGVVGITSRLHWEDGR